MAATKQLDAGLQLIANYERAIVAARMDHLRGAAGYSADDLAREQRDVEVLARRIGDAHRREYHARMTP